MDERDLISRLAELTGMLRPSSEVTDQDLKEVRRRLAVCLLRGQVETISVPPSEAPGPTALVRPEDLDPAVRDELAAVVQEASAQVSQQDAPRAEIRAFRRELPVLTSQSAASVPPWGAGLTIERSIGPFIDPSGRPFWFDFRLFFHQVSVVRGPANLIVLTIPQLGLLLQASDHYDLPQGSLWIRSQLITPSAPAGAFTGMGILGGTITLSASATIIAGAIQVPPGATLTLQITLDSPASGPISGFGPGGDARDAIIKAPDKATFVLPPGNLGEFVAASDASCEVYGTKVALKFTTPSVATFESALNRILIPFQFKPALFSIATLRSDLFRPKGEAPIEEAAWAFSVTLPDSTSGPQSLGDAVRASALVIVTSTSLTADWPGLEGRAGGSPQARLSRTLLLVEPGRLAVTAMTVDARRSAQTLELWRESGSIAGRRSTIDLTFDRSFILRFNANSSATGQNSELLIVSGIGAAAHLDRPVAADGGRIAFVSHSANFVLLEFQGQVRAALNAPAAPTLDPITGGVRPPQPMAIALTNALLRTTPISRLSLFGNMAVNGGIDSGNLALSFGVSMLLPTLPDPYAASFATPRELRGRGDLQQQGRSLFQLIGKVSWLNPET
jgi:hypothetical protein